MKTIRYLLVLNIDNFFTKPPMRVIITCREDQIESTIYEIEAKENAILTWIYKF